MTGTPIKRTLTLEQKAAAVERTRRWRLANPGRRNETDAKRRERLFQAVRAVRHKP